MMHHIKVHIPSKDAHVSLISGKKKKKYTVILSDLSYLLGHDKPMVAL